MNTVLPKIKVNKNIKQIKPVTQTANSEFTDLKINKLSINNIKKNIILPSLSSNRDEGFHFLKWKNTEHETVYTAHGSFTNYAEYEKMLATSTERFAPVRDLTRYGIESNPGPTLMTIYEDKVATFTTGIYQFCYNCEHSMCILECDESFIIHLNQCSMCIYGEQSQILSDESLSDIRNRFSGVHNWLMNGDKFGKSFLSHYASIPIDVDKHINLLEDIAILAHDFIYSTSLSNRYVAIVSFCKRRGSRIGFTTTLMYVAADLFGSDTVTRNKQDPLHSDIMDRLNYLPQSDDLEDNIFSEARKYVNCYDKLKETTIYKKLYKFSLYILTLGLLDGIKIDFNSLNFSSFEAKCVKETHKPGLDMIHCFLDTILFVCDKGMQYFKSGNSDVIFHSGSSYEKWIVKANKLLCDSKFLNNPEPLGIDKFSFLSDLKDAIEKGSAIVKFANGMDKHEKIYVNRVLNDLRMLEADQLTRKAAQMPRKDPFAVLIHGSSSICKSQLKQILFYHYGKVFNLPTSADYMYTRCPTDEYWSGFNSTQWCIVMDDIAFLKPNNEVDPTLKEMLQVKNSVPYTPPQASLEDKGRTPVRAELLIGTTNTKHLNLYAYFACPFAIARRMSYVITAQVKKEYAKHNFMADSNKIPITPDGEYMNIWNFEVAIPVPQLDIEVDNQQSKYVIIHTFTDINDLLVWYIGAAKEHESSQCKALNADKVMLNVEVCKTCYRATSKCTCFTQQSAETIIEDHSIIFKFQMWLYKNIITGCTNDDLELYLYLRHHFDNYTFITFLVYYMLICYFPIFIVIMTISIASVYLFYKNVWVILNSICAATGGIAWKYKLLFRITGNSEETYRFLLRCAGDKVKQMNFTNSNLKRLAAFLSLPMIILAIRKAYTNVVDKAIDKGVEIGLQLKCMHNNDAQSCEYCSQGNVEVIPKPDSVEKPTFYYHNPYVNTGVEISGASRCAQNDILSDNVKKATAKLIFQFTNNEGKYVAGIGINIYGSLWLVNKHVLKYTSGSVTVIRDPTEQNVSRNIKDICFCAKDVKYIDNSDLAIIEIRAIPPGVNLIKYFPLDDFIKGKYSGKYHLISKEGVRSELQLLNITFGSHCPIFGVPGYHARVNIPTSVGDCGAVCVAQIGNSQVLLGTHTCGNPNNQIFLQHVSQATLKKYINSFQPQVECGVVPISAPGYKRELIGLHPKSTVRFLDTGVANIIGSFTGYRPKHKSRVTHTYIMEKAIADGYKAEYGPPDMSWRPWNLALKDMVAPKYSFNNEILDKCADAYYGDVVRILGDKISQLEVYTQDVALNGVDGVTFVDRLNVSTSAGAPFKKSKKHFVTLGENGKITSIDPIIQSRIDEIEAAYKEGRRFHPQFCGQLKDEAIPWRKILLGKTRVFTSGEFAWSVVVRKYLLSHIRLIQNNPYAFEAMPGIVAQSKEWDRLYQYITKFGLKKIIAGDYGKFDKRMVAAFILAAFKVLEKLATKAGWPEEDLVFIRCIANDTAFPNIDFNGDFIEIQGNPSGHPLTVIINCIVNSLYMRYAFHHISGKNVEEFRKYVNLATYGDDNVMGVSDDCPNFTHTRIAVIMKLIGVEYTMADKEAESVPYIHVDDCSFLKRKFKFDPDIGKIVGPLDHSSIDKMLTSRLDEGNLDARAHSICVISTALREYFYYGKDKFEERRIFFQNLVKECDLEDWVEESTFPTWGDLYIDFHERLRYYPDHNITTWEQINFE
nr:MAG: structural polyprotein [Chemarfal virus 138]